MRKEAPTWNNDLKKYNTHFVHRNKTWGFVPKPSDQNKILADGIRLALDKEISKRNNNTLIIAKNYEDMLKDYMLPNMEQLNSNFFVCDPDGVLYNKMKGELKEFGYNIQVISTIDTHNSKCLDPFSVISIGENMEKDIDAIVQAIIPMDATNNRFFLDITRQLLSWVIRFNIYKAVYSEDMYREIFNVIQKIQNRDMESAIQDMKRRRPDIDWEEEYEEIEGMLGKSRRAFTNSVCVSLVMYRGCLIEDMSHKQIVDFSALSRPKQAIFIIYDRKAYPTPVVELATWLFTKHVHAYNASNCPSHERVVILHENPTEYTSDLLNNNYRLFRDHNISFSLYTNNMSQWSAICKSYEYIADNCDSILYLGCEDTAAHKYMLYVLESIRNGKQDQHDAERIIELDDKKCIVAIRGILPFYKNRFTQSKK